MHLKLITDKPYPQFAVYDQDKVLVKIKVDEEMQALRISCRGSRRVFFIAEEKLRKGTFWNLVNEYSQPLGTLLKSRVSENAGEIDIEGMKLNYTLLSRPVNEIVLADYSEEPVLSCLLNDALLISYRSYINYFIFALAWFTFLSKEEKEGVLFAEA